MNPALCRRVYAVFTVLGGASGGAAIVLPFTWGVSPLDALHIDRFYLLVPAFLMAPLITAVSVRWLRAGRLRPFERGLAVLGGMVTALSTIAFIVWAVVTELPPALLEWTAVLLPGVLLLGSGCFVESAAATPDVRSIAAMQAAVTANSTFCLVAYAGEWQLGAWCALATLLSYGVQIVCMIACENGARSGRNGPPLPAQGNSGERRQTHPLHQATIPRVAPDHI